MIELARSPEAAPLAAYMAAVDLGSNSFHMVIARMVDGDLQLLHREKQKVQLAEGLNDQLVLSEEAIERGLRVLAQFADTLKPFGPQSVRVIATYTLRRARNAATFLRRARTVFPFPIEVISGQEEARYIYQGVAHYEFYTGRRLVIDIGGGSTEFAIGEGMQPLRLSSRNMGCVSYAMQHFAQGKISARRFDRAILQASQELEPIASGFRQVGWQQAVGTSGTVKVIRDVIVALELGSHQLELAHLLALKQHLLQLDTCYELDVSELTDERKLLICSGLAILIAAFQLLQIEQLSYNDAALREGVLYEMRDRLQHNDIRADTVASMQRRYDIDPAHAARVSATATLLFEQLRGSWQLNDEDAMSLNWAAALFEVGLHINSSGLQKHSAYILQNANMPGFNQEQQLLVATLVRFHRRKIRPEEIPTFNLYPLSQVTCLIVLVRLAVLLNQKRLDDFLPAIKVSGQNSVLQLELDRQWLTQQSLLVADLQAEQKMLKKFAFTLECSGLTDIAQS